MEERRKNIWSRVWSDGRMKRRARKREGNERSELLSDGSLWRRGGERKRQRTINSQKMG